MKELSPPQQTRSVATLNAIAVATKHLLKTHTFAELTIDQVVTAAGTSTGSFYARFKNKRALLHHLHVEFTEASKVETEKFIELVRPKKMSSETFADLWIPSAVVNHIEHHGLIRATMIETLEDPRFAQRASSLVTHISTELSDIVINPFPNREAHIHNIADSIGAVLSILNMHHLYLRKYRQQSLDDTSLNRLKRMFAASLKPS